MEDKPVILITGSSGFIGSALARRLSPHYYIVGLDYKKPDYDPVGMSHYEVDITSSEDVKKTLADVREKFGPRLISVIHLIAYYSFDGEEDERYDTITVQGTMSLLENLKHFFQVEQFIFSSSMLVYKPTAPGQKITETSPVQRSWAYPNSKLDVEEMLQKEHGEIPILNLRIAGVYDETCHQPTLAHQILRIFEGWATSVPFPGNADHGQAMLHLDDLATAIDLCVDKRYEFKGFETLALAEEEVMSYRELQKEIGTLIHQRPWPVVRIPAFVAKTGAAVMEKLPIIREPFIKPWMIPHSDEHFEIDVSKVRRKLGWEPQFHLKKVLPEMIHLLKTDPQEWYQKNKMEKPFYRELDLINSEREKSQWMLLVAIIFIGIWMIFTPFSFENESSYEVASEVISGVLLMILGALSLIPTLRWLRWGLATVGTWLMFSPLVFSSPMAASYINDTLVGFLVTVMSVYTPSPIKDQERFGLPSGWSYNPSTAGQRLPIMFLGFLGFIFSRYLASYQLGHISLVWDPFFIDGTARVLTSDVSKAFPVSDAGLGAFTYLLDVVAATIGGRYRWRTMPWAVILFGFMIIPAGVTSIVLIMLQPISVGAWCSACLLTAFIMLLMVPPAIDEVVASAQFLFRIRREGKPFWKTFWLGDSETEFTEVMPKVKAPSGSVVHLVGLVLLGTWLMWAPYALELTPYLSDRTYIIAALVLTFSIIAFSEIARISRVLNIPLGIRLLTLAFSSELMTSIDQWNFIATGVGLIILSLPRGKRQEKFGDIDGIIHWTPLRR